MIDDLAALARARREFETRLAAVTPGDLERPTPCDGWDVRALVDHVLAGDLFAARVLGGATLTEAIDGLLGVDLVTDAVLDDFRRGADAVAAAFADADPDSTVHHVEGDIAVRLFIEFRTADYTGHAWDLAVATDQDATLDPDLIESLVARVDARRDSLADSPHYGGGPRDAHDGTAQGRLLDLLGRASVD